MKKDLTPQVICFGEILWDVLPDGPQPGGAPLNVAYHLHKLGINAAIISKIGDDLNGVKLEQLIDNWGISKQFLQNDFEYPTSEVVAKMNDGNEVSYEIIFPVAWDFIEHDPQIDRLLTSSTYFVYGSLASRNEPSKTTLSKFLESDAIKVFDINLRSPFYNKSLLAELMEKADIIKFNESELRMSQVLFGGTFNNEASQVKFIQDRFKVPEIIVTKGEYGASYYKNDESFHSWGSEIKVKDTIGSGDSFLAAFIANHLSKQDAQTTIKNAIMMGGFIATMKGGCPSYQLSEYTNFKTQIC